MGYNLISQDKFTQEQKQYIESMSNSFNMNFPMQEIMFIIKDIDSKYMSTSDYSAKLFGFSRREDAVGIFDRDLPCKVSEFAQDFVKEEQDLLSYRDGNRKKSMLNIHEYATGFESFICYKQPIIHKASQLILGTTAIAHKIDLSSFFTLIPNYFLEFGVQGNLENVQGDLKVNNIHLTPYEHEVCFLATMNLSYKQIAGFMNKYRPIGTERTADTIYKCRDRVCEKINCMPLRFRDALIGMNIHKKIPTSFLNRMIGNKPLA